jgi:anti-anti-sigma regulatory factor
MIGFRLTILESQKVAVLHAALPPDADEILELESFLPALAAKGFTRAVLDLSLAPTMDPAEALMLREAARRLANLGIRLALVAVHEAPGAPHAGIGLPVHACLSDALLRGN